MGLNLEVESMTTYHQLFDCFESELLSKLDYLEEYSTRLQGLEQEIRDEQTQTEQLKNKILEALVRLRTSRYRSFPQRSFDISDHQLYFEADIESEVEENLRI